MASVGEALQVLGKVNVDFNGAREDDSRGVCVEDKNEYRHGNRASVFTRREITAQKGSKRDKSTERE